MFDKLKQLNELRKIKKRHAAETAEAERNGVKIKINGGFTRGRYFHLARSDEQRLGEKSEKLLQRRREQNASQYVTKIFRNDGLEKLIIKPVFYLKKCTNFFDDKVCPFAKHRFFNFGNRRHCFAFYNLVHSFQKSLKWRGK